MSEAVSAVINGVAIPDAHPEAEFLRHWATHLVDPRDPQNNRWLTLEAAQLDRGRRLCHSLAKWMPLDGARVLDLGCQTGALTVALAERGAKATGVDVAENLIEAARVRAKGALREGQRAEFLVAKGEALPFDGSSFDMVAFVDVIEHVENAQRALGEAARVLRPGGVFWLQGPNRLSPRWFWRDPHYQMTGISVLPPALGRFYVTTVRGRPRYDVGVFPVGSRVVKTLERMGFEILARPGAIGLRFAGMFELVARKK